MARTLHALCQPYLAQLKPISLSPAISQTLAELGWPANAEAKEATEEALVEALLAAV
jgi:uroporphyrinogen-III synthase